jgi:F-type H+-transporting ATPase subunit b
VLESIDQSLLQAGLVDLDGTFLFQLGLFLLFFVLLNAIVIKPMSKVYDTRYERMEGARKEAEAMDLKAGEALDAYDGKLAVARRAAVGGRDEIKAAADAERREVVSEARAVASQQADAAAAKRQAAAATALAQADKEAEVLAEAIAARLLGGAGGKL